MSWDVKRPMSTHLQVVKLPFTAKLSILHRATGAALYFGIILIVITLLSAVFGEKSWGIMHGILSSWLGKLVLLGFILSLYYHLCNGIRHLFWDFGKGLELEQANKSGIAVVVISIILTIITWLVASLGS